MCSLCEFTDCTNFESLLHNFFIVLENKLYGVYAQ